MRIVLLGASGNTGREITRLLSPMLAEDDRWCWLDAIADGWRPPPKW